MNTYSVIAILVVGSLFSGFAIAALELWWQARKRSKSEAKSMDVRA